VGGGISIGIVSGKKEYLDALDGGPWQYGDSSTPEIGVTYFAGTFVRHPLALAAARAALLYMKKHGPSLQAELNQRADDFALELNTYFKQRGAPLQVLNFGSVFKLKQTQEVPFGELLYHHLRLAGVHVWDGRPCFLTLCHQRVELEFIVAAFKQAVEEMFRGGLFQAAEPKPVLNVMDAAVPPVQGARIGHDPDGNPAWYVPDAERPGKYLRFDSAASPAQ
jgi:glutamate-1-semialdehyde aminotransferase